MKQGDIVNILRARLPLVDDVNLREELLLATDEIIQLRHRLAMTEPAISHVDGPVSNVSTTPEALVSTTEKVQDEQHDPFAAAKQKALQVRDRHEFNRVLSSLAGLSAGDDLTLAHDFVNVIQQVLDRLKVDILFNSKRCGLYVEKNSEGKPRFVVKPLKGEPAGKQSPRNLPELQCIERKPRRVHEYIKR